MCIAEAPSVRKCFNDTILASRWFRLFEYSLNERNYTCIQCRTLAIQVQYQECWLRTNTVSLKRTRAICQKCMWVSRQLFLLIALSSPDCKKQLMKYSIDEKVYYFHLDHRTIFIIRMIQYPDEYLNNYKCQYHRLNHTKIQLADLERIDTDSISISTSTSHAPMNLAAHSLCLFPTERNVPDNWSVWSRTAKSK